jgi:hypothetical protein
MAQYRRSVEDTLGVAATLLATETVLDAGGDLSAVHPSLYEGVGLTKDEFEEMARPLVTSATARIEEVCGGNALAHSLRYWAEGPGNRKNEYRSAIREAFYGDTRRLNDLMMRFHLA